MIYYLIVNCVIYLYVLQSFFVMDFFWYIFQYMIFKKLTNKWNRCIVVFCSNCTCQYSLQRSWFIFGSSFLHREKISLFVLLSDNFLSYVFYLLKYWANSKQLSAFKVSKILSSVYYLVLTKNYIWFFARKY